MAEYNEDLSSPDPPPPYSSTVSNHPSPAAVEGAAPVVTAQQMTHPEHIQSRNSDRQREHSNRCTRQGRHHHTGSSEGVINHTTGTLSASNSFSGFIDIMYEKKRLPRSFVERIIYKLGRILYFFVNFVYSIILFSAQGGQLPYHIVYISMSLIGCAIELIIIKVTMRKCLTADSDIEDDTTQSLLLNQMETQRADEQVQNYLRKAKRVLADFVFFSVGEFLIYPTLICVLYGFINERSWQFDNKIQICNLIMLVYNVIMDALYMKFYVILLVVRVLRASYAKYDELTRPTEVEWKRYFTPVYLSIPFAITTALTHWFMTGLIAVRIYIDAFNTMEHNTNSSIPDTGDYRVAPLTGYMIGCTIYLPIMSWITYIIINKPWFYKVYSAINQLGTGRASHMPEGYKWNKKLFAFTKDPWAYTAIVLLMVPFIGFIVAVYLPNYDSADYEVPSSVRYSADTRTMVYCLLLAL